MFLKEILSLLKGEPPEALMMTPFPWCYHSSSVSNCLYYVLSMNIIQLYRCNMKLRQLLEQKSLVKLFKYLQLCWLSGFSFRTSCVISNH